MIVWWRVPSRSLLRLRFFQGINLLRHVHLKWHTFHQAIALWWWFDVLPANTRQRLMHDHAVQWLPLSMDWHIQVARKWLHDLLRAAQWNGVQLRLLFWFSFPDHQWYGLLHPENLVYQQSSFHGGLQSRQLHYIHWLCLLLRIQVSGEPVNLHLHYHLF